MSFGLNCAELRSAQLEFSLSLSLPPLLFPFRSIPFADMDRVLLISLSRKRGWKRKEIPFLPNPFQRSFRELLKQLIEGEDKCFEGCVYLFVSPVCVTRDEIMDFIYLFSIRKSYLRREIDESAMLESRNARQFEATSLVKLGRR